MPDRRRPRSKTDADSYRRAAQDALGQLEWAISYLYRIRKFEIAEMLQKNARRIAGRLR